MENENEQEFMHKLAPIYAEKTSDEDLNKEKFVHFLNTMNRECMYMSQTEFDEKFEKNSIVFKRYDWSTKKHYECIIQMKCLDK
jgi:hypothetical protein